MQKIAVLDFGIGNVSSVIRACKLLGVNAFLTKEPKNIMSADRLIVPGDGAFGDTMVQLQKRDLINPIINFTETGKPFLGICVGMQILFEIGEEFGLHKGLGLIKGKVSKFQESDRNTHFKIPQIGWNQLIFPTNIKSWKSSILADNIPGDWVYFVHSYIVIPEIIKYTIAVTKYGKDTYCSVIQKKNVIGCQFHPEKSGVVGLKILKRFLESV